MRTRLLQTLMALAFAGVSASALADDIPSLVGRVALAQGPVGISMDGGESMAAQVNWPVTSGELVTTARGARTELQVGGAFIRLDGDSSLEVLQLDDGSLRLRLHYGSANIRIIDPVMLAGFELTTPEGRVTLQEPGRIRVDAERIADTSSVTVIEGLARVECSGASLVLRTGRRADLRDDDVRTFTAGRDEFDDWSLARDRANDSAIASRYVSPDMTGYADLDRYGTWQTDPEYGALWFPTTVAVDWTPYSDGSWVWVDPWGWTWVDNAPWGYAPFHYGRWLFVRSRWCWVPGRIERHPVWSPALVGWVGGDNWRFDHHNRPMPGRGWFPLTPHDRFVPSFRMSDDRLRRLNVDVRPDSRRRFEERRGLTVVPQDQFSQRGRVQVANVPHMANLPPGITRQLQNAAPPAAPAFVRERDGRRDERGAFEHRGWPNGQQPNQVLTAPSMPRVPDQRPAPGVPAQQPQWRERQDEGRRPMPVMNGPQAAQPLPQQWQRDRRAEEGRQQAPAMSAPQPAAPAQPSPMPWRDRREEGRQQLMAQPAPAPQPMPAAAPVQPTPQQWQEQRRQRFDEERRQRFEDERRQMGAASTPGERFERRREQLAPQVAQPAPLSQPVQPIPAPPPVIPRQQPMQAPPPVAQRFEPMPAPRPVMQAERMAPPPPPPAPAPRHEPEHRGGGGHEDQKRQEQK